MPRLADEEYRNFLKSLDSVQKGQLRQYLESFVTESKRGQMDRVLRHRTRHVVVVLENVFQPHNTSAALRSCECFGFQDLHVIETDFDHEINPDVTMGGCKWITLHHHSRDEGGTVPVLSKIKGEGYRIVATSLRPGCTALDALDLSAPSVVCFGTEEKGLSEEAHDMADEFVQIPSFGFTRSFNVSVSVALCLSSIRRRLESSSIAWQLNEDVREVLYLTWLMRTANRGLALARRFFSADSAPRGSG